MVGRLVTTSLQPQVYDAWKASGLKLNHVVHLGLMSASKTPGFVMRINELEEDNKKLQRKLQILMNKVNELEKPQVRA